MNKRHPTGPCPYCGHQQPARPALLALFANAESAGLPAPTSAECVAALGVSRGRVEQLASVLGLVFSPAPSRGRLVRS